MAITDNKNLLIPNSFRFQLDPAQFPNINFFNVACELPAIDASSAASTFRTQNLYVPGDKLVYNPLTISFMVDEDMDNYKEIFDWIVHNSNNDTDPIYSDGTLTVLNSHNNQVRQFYFHDLIPIIINGFEFDSQTTAAEPIRTQVTFQYTKFEFV